jgi:RNA polymerase sigma factor (sigma-70 family)
MNDPQILAGIKSGGRQRELVATTIVAVTDWPLAVMKMVLARGGTEAMALDVFTDSYLIFEKNILHDRFNEKSELKTYFIGIAKNILLQVFKQNKVALEFDEINEEVHAIPEEEIEDLKDNKVILSQIMTLMGVRCKLILTFDMYGYKLKEIAEELGFASDSVAGNEVKKCKDKLRQLLSKPN